MASSEASTRRRPDPRGLELRRVFGHAILDSEDRRAGRVEDLVLELRDEADGSPRLVLTDLVGGPLSGPMPSWLRAAAHAGYRLLGLRDATPVTLSWARVKVVDAFVHLSGTRGDAGLDQVEAAVARWMGRLPNG